MTVAVEEPRNRVIVDEVAPNAITVISSPNIVTALSTSIPPAKILAGDGPPAETLGIGGDYYLDQIAAGFYGPKTSAGWGTPIILGSTGPQGPQGIQGPQGPQGPQGVAVGEQFDFVTPLTTWTINHNRGYYPNINVYTSGGVEVAASVQNISLNQIVVNFNTAQAGYVRVT